MARASIGLVVIAASGLAASSTACSSKSDPPPPSRRPMTPDERAQAETEAWEAESREKQRLEAPEPNEPRLPIALSGATSIEDLQHAKLAIYVLDREMPCAPMFVENSRLMTNRPPGPVQYWDIASSGGSRTKMGLFGPTHAEIDAAGRETVMGAAACVTHFELVASEPGLYVLLRDPPDKVTTYQASQTVRWYTDAARCRADFDKMKSKKAIRC